MDRIFRTYLVCLSWALFVPHGKAQLSINGGQVIIAAGTKVVATGLSVVNHNGAIVTNQGLLATSVHINNATGGTLQGNGTWQMDGNWINAGEFDAGTSTVLFTGAGPSVASSGGDPFYNLHLDKTGNALSLASPAAANHEVRFIAENNRLICSNYNFTIGPAAVVTDADADDFFVTDGTGALIRSALGNSGFLYPVGADNDTYNPLLLQENGIPDDIGVRCLEAPLQNGSSGPPLTDDGVSVAWEVSELNNGGSDLDATASWVTGDELPGFDGSQCGIARFSSGTDWDLPPAWLATAAGTGPFSRQRNNLAPGILSVLDDAYLNRVKISPRIMLQGPFNTGTMQMNDNLRTLPAFPLTAPAPYGSGKFAHAGWQPASGYAIDPAVLTVTGDDAIVDWVFVWLKDPGNPTTNIQTRVALLQKDGDVVDLDGESPVAVPGDAGNYIIGIGHRNHLSVRMPNGSGIALNEQSTTVYDFTTAMAQAYGTNPMQQVQAAPTAIFALWGGNTSGNNSVRATGPPTINDYSVILNTLGFPSNIISNVYSDSDVNMNGTVRVTGPPTINDYSKLLSILGTPTTIINEQQ